MHHEKHTRSIIKSITWRIIASLTTAILVYAFTGSLSLTAKISAIEITAKIIFYYLHERAWNTVHWGRIVKS